MIKRIRGNCMRILEEGRGIDRGALDGDDIWLLRGTVLYKADMERRVWGKIISVPDEFCVGGRWGFNLQVSKKNVLIFSCIMPAVIVLPSLRHDNGDIAMLNELKLFPDALVTVTNTSNDGFYGNIKALNWPNAKNYKKIEKKKYSVFGRIIRFFVSFLVLIFGDQKVERLGQAFSESRTIL